MESVEDLVELLGGALAPPAAVVCIGSELRGDDAAGVAVAEGLADLADPPWTLHDARNAPESYLGRIAGLPNPDASGLGAPAGGPASILLIDALHFAGRPGEVRLLSPAELAGLAPTTHGPGPVLFLEALAERLAPTPCRITVLGIQPVSLEVGQPLTPPRRRRRRPRHRGDEEGGGIVRPAIQLGIAQK